MSTPANADKLLVTELAVEGLDCPEEAKLIEKSLRPIAGIESISPNFLDGTVKVSHSSLIDAKSIAIAIESAGLKVKPVDQIASENPTSSLNSRLLMVIGSGLFLGVGMMLTRLKVVQPVHIPTFIFAILIGGALVAPKALRSLKARTLDMNVLMVVAVAGACFIGEWAEGAAVTFLFSLSEYLESFSVSRARKAVESLLKLTPQVANVKVGSAYTEKSLSAVVVGDLVQVRAGARIPVDGTIQNGSSSVDQSPITGESVPVEKKPGDPVFAGTINGEGMIEITVSKRSSESTIAGIVRLVKDAQGQKAPSQRFVDRFAEIYTPAVMIAALAIFLVMPLFFGGEWSVWLYRSLVLLVIACPCALVISTPVTIVSGLTAMAKRGVLVKGGTHLEALGKIRALAVDKTGTITEGKPALTGIHPMRGATSEKIIRIAASLESSSDHPLAQAVMSYAKEKNVQYPESKNLQSLTGMGVRGVIDGHDYFLGNHHFAEKLGVCSKELEDILADLEYNAQSVIVVGHAPHGLGDEEVLGVIAVSDVVRKEAKAALAAIHRAGVQRIVMLSGDNTRTAQTIASQVGIDDARGNLLPADKITAVQELVSTYGSVAMIGDGVNDAPAMAASTVGIAMGGIGTDTAIETADVTLMNDDLMKVADAIVMGKRTLRIIQFNISFSLAVKFVFLILAVVGYSSLWLAILADTGATILVILNALRLLAFRNAVQSSDLA